MTINNCVLCTVNVNQTRHIPKYEVAPRKENMVIEHA